MNWMRKHPQCVGPCLDALYNNGMRKIGYLFQLYSSTKFIFRTLNASDIDPRYGLWWKFVHSTMFTTSQVDLSSRINRLRPRQNGRHFADDTFKHIFMNENVRISIKISLKFVSKGPINNIPALVQIMAGRRPGGKPLSKAMMVRLPTHICVTRPQWVDAFNEQTWYYISF